jgi:phage shock protein A
MEQENPLIEDERLARRLLKLEAQIEAYRSLHQEELDELRQALSDLRDKMLSTKTLTAEDSRPKRQ